MQGGEGVAVVGGGWGLGKAMSVGGGGKDGGGVRLVLRGRDFGSHGRVERW